MTAEFFQKEQPSACFYGTLELMDGKRLIASSSVKNARPRAPSKFLEQEKKTIPLVFTFTVSKELLSDSKFTLDHLFDDNIGDVYWFYLRDFAPSVAWPSLDSALASSQPITNVLTQPIEIECVPHGDVGRWIGGNYIHKIIVRSINKERWRSGPYAMVVWLKGDRVLPAPNESHIWLEAMYRKALPSLDDVLKANSAEVLDNLFGIRTSLADGYDGGGSHNRYYYFTVQPDGVLYILLVEFETSGVAKGELRVWTASCKIPN